MAIGDLEYPLKRGPTKEIRLWSSTWVDRLNAGGMLHARLQISRDKNDPHLWDHRALIESAVLAYARSFTSGERRGTVDTVLLSWKNERRTRPGSTTGGETSKPRS